MIAILEISSHIVHASKKKKKLEDHGSHLLYDSLTELQFLSATVGIFPTNPRGNTEKKKNNKQGIHSVSRSYNSRHMYGPRNSLQDVIIINL
jgi:hypothetical protein